MPLPNTNRYRPHPSMLGVSVLTITRARCPDGGDSRGPREIEVLLDTCDVALAEKHAWSVYWAPNNRSFYVTTNIRTSTGRSSRGLHRMLLSPEDPSIEVDHRNGITTDNRRENLRLATPPENRRNSGLQRNNVSGCTGVRWRNDRQCWQVYIAVNGKQIHLGYYDVFEEACAVRIAAENKYHGEFSFSARKAA